MSTLVRAQKHETNKTTNTIQTLFIRVVQASNRPTINPICEKCAHHTHTHKHIAKVAMIEPRARARTWSRGAHEEPVLRAPIAYIHIPVCAKMFYHARDSAAPRRGECAQNILVRLYKMYTSLPLLRNPSQHTVRLVLAMRCAVYVCM